VIEKFAVTPMDLKLLRILAMAEQSSNWHADDYVSGTSCLFIGNPSKFGKVAYECAEN